MTVDGVHQFGWMQSGHAQAVVALRFMPLGSPVLLYETCAAFVL